MKTSCFRWFVMCLMVCPKRAEDKMLHPCALSPLGYFNSPPYVRGRQCGPVCQRTLPPVHPRAYGEDLTGFVNYCQQLRFTPVRTGKTLLFRGDAGHVAVHPRAYGEDCRRLWLVATLWRFTPVRTGKTFRVFRLSRQVSVHPRAYGED